MLIMLPGKRQWQRVANVAACEKRRREEDDEEEIISDKTLLLSSETFEHPKFDQDLYLRTPLHAEEDELPLQSRWTCDGPGVTQHPEPWFSSGGVGNFDHSMRTRKQDSDCASFPIRKHCHHASWQGFKQLVRKQFMPSFPFGKEMPCTEMQHLRQRRMEGAMNKASRVLGASTNLVELRKLDAKIQNGINKSAFVASTRKGKSKENLNCNQDENVEISKAVKLSSQTELSSNVSARAEATKIKASKDDCRMPRNRMKENGILRKLKGRTKKDPCFYWLIHSTRP